LLGTGAAQRQFIFSHDVGRILLELLRVSRGKLVFTSVILCDEDGSVKRVTRLGLTLVCGSGKSSSVDVYPFLYVEFAMGEGY